MFRKWNERKSKLISFEEKFKQKLPKLLFSKEKAIHFFCFYKYFLLVYPIKLLDPEQSPMLMDLTKYIEKTWITSSVWPVHSWSVFMRPTRANNDVEGWHHRLNKDKKAGSGNKGLYTIAPLLIEEANLLPIQIQLVSEGKLKKLQRRHVRTTHRLLFNQWESST